MAGRMFSSQAPRRRPRSIANKEHFFERYWDAPSIADGTLRGFMAPADGFIRSVVVTVEDLEDGCTCEVEKHSASEELVLTLMTFKMKETSQAYDDLELSVSKGDRLLLRVHNPDGATLPMGWWIAIRFQEK